MDKNKFWLGGRLFNTSAMHVCKLGGPMHVHNARHVRNANARQGTSANANAWHVRNARHIRNLGAPTQRKARPQDGRPNAKLIRNENVHTREH